MSRNKYSGNPNPSQILDKKGPSLELGEGFFGAYVWKQDQQQKLSSIRTVALHTTEIKGIKEKQIKIMVSFTTPKCWQRN